MATIHVPRATGAFALIFGAALLAGCASSSQPKFSCPAEATGYGCKSTLEVYEITSAPGAFNARHKPEQRNPPRARRVATAPARANNSHAIGSAGAALALQGPVQSNAGAFTSTAALSLGGPAPMPAVATGTVARLPAQVMRIWIAPWTDERGDLHRPSHIYTEITGRRWAVGGDVRDSYDAQASFDPNGPMFPKSDLHEGN